MRLMPASLFGRLLIALLLAIGATLLIVVALLLSERRDSLFAGSDAAAIVNAVDSTAQRLAALESAERSAEIERLRNEPPAIERVQLPRQLRPPGAETAEAVRVLQSRLARSLGSGYRVEVRPAKPGESDVIRLGPERRFVRPEREIPLPPPEASGDAPQEPRGETSPPRGFGGPGRPGGFPLRQLDVAVTLPDGTPVTFRTEVPRPSPGLPSGLLLELGVITLVLASVLYVMARTITRPLSKLAIAAEAVGRGARQAPLPETGARELRNATRAFNTMQERLQRYLDSRTHFLAAMSHDLRTPLTRLKLRAETLDDPALRDRFNADLDEMNSMVRGALNLFKGVDHDEPLENVPVDALLADVRGEFAEIGAAFTVNGSAAPLLVRPVALKRCLTNLVANAGKYGSNTTVVIEDSPAELVIRVRDEGPGIPVDMLEHVFEPFFRLESSRNADTGGVGLGLSIARDIAQSHGGSLVLENRSPHGLEATLRLPRAA
ncbi:MAG: ATP-binding protein [Gammaproteobacteria bacterium]